MAGISYEYRGSQVTSSTAYLYPSVSQFLKDAAPGSIVFDAGCGNGSFLALFQDRGWRLFGSDMSPSGVEIAQKSFPNITFFLADGQSKYEEFLQSVGQVDVVMSTEVVEHVYNPRGFLQSCHDLLKPDGMLVITTPYHGYLKNLMLAVTGKLDKHFTVLWDHGHIKFWSRKTLQQALTETGFTDFEFAGAGRVPYMWKSMVIKARKAQ